MFFRDLKPKPGAMLDVTLAQVHLPVKLGHRDAEKLYAAPLKAQLAAAGLGTVIDCRTRTRPTGEPLGVDMALGLTRASQAALATVAGMLEYLAAPCGSSIRLADSVDEPMVFGRTEGLELSIASDAAPDADTRRDLALLCKEAIQHIGVSRGWDARLDRTLFYFYGENYAEMKDSLSRGLAEHPRFSRASLRRMA
ncbi:hypothetical protein EF888_03605 [Silicimonas algicola]|uniref:Uncharacterized protein n=1 Tax=Silicimonas algicola TaxID=1826607 RepID=A0A316GGW8_9RHOB|nr:hypothetical protein [Silicimonas algicola]AZQ66298.1 hypothetical protein EF888_03605 [Silicimonas algicola]PWK58620.1 hypothetical protein C8D95_101434 [Silicimonas algicola]